MRSLALWSTTPLSQCEHTPHTSYVLTELHAHAWLKAQVACLSCAHHVSSSCVCSDSLRLLHFLLFAHHLLSYHPVLPLTHQLHLPRCGGQIPSLCTLANEDLGTLAEYDPLTGYEPNDYHISEATELYIQESSVENGSPNDVEYDDATIGKALSSPLFIQEREDDACRRRAYHSQEEGLSSSLSSSVSHDRTVRPVVKPFDSPISCVREIPSHSSESEQIRILLERHREQILADCQAEIRKHEFQADYDRRSIQKLNEMIEAQKEETYRAHQGRLRRDQQLLHEQSLEQNRELREAHVKSLNEMEELKRFQGSTFDGFSRRK